MAKRSDKETKARGKSQEFSSAFFCCDPEKISQIAKNSCGDEEISIDFLDTMKKMFGKRKKKNKD